MTVYTISTVKVFQDLCFVFAKRPSFFLTLTLSRLSPPHLLSSRSPVRSRRHRLSPSLPDPLVPNPLPLARWLSFSTQVHLQHLRCAHPSVCIFSDVYRPPSSFASPRRTSPTRTIGDLLLRLVHLRARSSRHLRLDLHTRRTARSWLIGARFGPADSPPVHTPLAGCAKERGGKERFRDAGMTQRSTEDSSDTASRRWSREPRDGERVELGGNGRKERGRKRKGCDFAKWVSWR